MSKKTKKTALVTDVTPESCVGYGTIIVGFYDNPRTITDKEGNKTTQDRVYIDIATPQAKQQHVRRKARPDEFKRYNTAYNKYLDIKESGGVLSVSTAVAEKDKEIEDLRKQLAAKQNESKVTDEIAQVAAKAAKPTNN